ncbi:hypothetical protein G7043_23420 [Lentzea sp. NEAU-D13]|uniref:Uncharacterized protein n=1 Tax=Lentzea alba TaxID=2714351 RepID=A0A7C9RVS3_9PSEU|nr:hypothetical protein [Lentzea alba]NGY61882.1 hypothetical protein [Lentzea alba]
MARRSPTAVDGHRRLACGQRRCHHPSGERARLEQLDADLDLRHVVAVEHDCHVVVATTAVGRATTSTTVTWWTTVPPGTTSVRVVPG